MSIKVHIAVRVVTVSALTSITIIIGGPGPSWANHVFRPIDTFVRRNILPPDPLVLRKRSGADIGIDELQRSGGR